MEYPSSGAANPGKDEEPAQNPSQEGQTAAPQLLRGENPTCPAVEGGWVWGSISMTEKDVEPLDRRLTSWDLLRNPGRQPAKVEWGQPAPLRGRRRDRKALWASVEHWGLGVAGRRSQRQERVPCPSPL